MLRREMKGDDSDDVPPPHDLTSDFILRGDTRNDRIITGIPLDKKIVANLKMKITDTKKQLKQ